MELWNQGYGEYKDKNNRVCFFLNMPDYFLYGNILLIWIHDGAYLKLSAVLLPLWKPLLMVWMLTDSWNLHNNNSRYILLSSILTYFHNM